MIGEGTTVTFVDGKRPAKSSETASPSEIAAYLGRNPKALGVASWDVYDAVLTTGDLILMMVWKTKANADAFALCA